MEANPQETKKATPCRFWCSEDLEATPSQTAILEEDFELKQLSCRMNSFVDEGPFHETKYQTQKQDLSYKAEFHGDVFLEFFAYYMLFFLAFGPFSRIFFVRSPALFYNLGFWSCRLETLFQMLLWCGSIFCTFVYVSTGLLTNLEIGLLWFAVFFRCIIMATKFGTMPLDRIQLYRTTRLTEKATRFDTVLFDWAEQTQKIQLLEMIRAAKRHDFDTREFYIEFLVDPMEETVQALDKIKIDLEDRPNQFSGFKIISYFIQKFQGQQTRKYITLLAALQSIAVLLPPKLIMSQSYTPNDIAFVVVCFFFQWISLNCLFIYLYLGVDDMKRKLFLLEQCEYMISTKRTKCHENKLTPTINLHNPSTIESWSILKSIVFDYGGLYHMRNQFHYTMLFVFCLASIVCALQMILDYFTLELYLLLPLSTLAVFFFIFIVRYMLYAAEINKYFDEFKKQLENIKFIYSDIRRMKDTYFQAGKGACCEPINFIHKSFVTHLKQKHDQNYGFISDAIDQAIQSLEDCLSQNEYDSNNFPLKLYGVKITQEILQSAFMALCTIFSFVVQQRFSQVES